MYSNFQQDNGSLITHNANPSTADTFTVDYSSLLSMTAMEFEVTATIDTTNNYGTGLQYVSKFILLVVNCDADGPAIPSIAYFFNTGVP